jgi:hypothetical protein
MYVGTCIRERENRIDRWSEANTVRPLLHPLSLDELLLQLVVIPPRNIHYNILSPCYWCCASCCCIIDWTNTRPASRSPQGSGLGLLWESFLVPGMTLLWKACKILEGIMIDDGFWALMSELCEIDGSWEKFSKLRDIWYPLAKIILQTAI